MEDKLDALYELMPGQTYKDIDFVKNECKKLAKQLHEVLNGDNGKD